MSTMVKRVAQAPSKKWGLLHLIKRHLSLWPAPPSQRCESQRRQGPMVFENFTPWVAMKGQYQVRILSDHAVP